VTRKNQKTPQPRYPHTHTRARAKGWRTVPVDVNDVPLFGQLERQVFGLPHIVALHNDGGPEISARFYFDDRRHHGHDDRHGYVQPTAVVAQRLRVVPQRRGNHAVPFVLFGQHHQRVARTAFFEAEYELK